MKRLAYILTLCIIFCFKSSEKDYEVKYGFINKLTRFIKFPESDAKKFNFATYKEEVFKSISKYALQKKAKINNKVLAFTTLQDLNNTNSIDVLFVPKAYKSDLKSIIKATESFKTIVITEQPFGAQKGAVINLIENKGKLQFEINKSVAKTKKIEIHSKILKLSKKIY